MRKYYNHSVKKAVTVKNLTTIESLEIANGFYYPEEKHDFYELVYINSGSLECRLSAEPKMLEHGELLLIKPETAHSYLARTESTVFIICFSASSAVLDLLDTSIRLQNEEKRLFFEIINEAKSAFCFPFKRKLEPLPSPVFGAQQMVVVKMEEFLLCLLRNALRESAFIKPVMNSTEREKNLTRDIVAILKKKLYSRITLDDICAQLFYSKTYLNGVFKKNTGMTIIQYYHKLKLAEAKKLLSDGLSTYEIVSRLSFDSASYFIKFFKRYEKITPSAWRKVK
jgi:AraC-like DNA-binding protein/quercetin dioxygenase-like cupin family protein